MDDSMLNCLGRKRQIHRAGNIDDTASAFTVTWYTAQLCNSFIIYKLLVHIFVLIIVDRIIEGRKRSRLRTNI
jgi:hypothetical protein